MISQRPPVSIPAFRRAANPFEMGESLEGEQLGHFQLGQFVGGGGMGAVFRGTDLTLGRTVAIKVVLRDQTGEDALRRFRNEAQSAARLDHPNIARVYFVGEDKGWNYIVFEYIEGLNVRDLVDHNGPLPLEDAIRYTLQIAEALEHASQRDVIHRDIKPSNILIMVDGRAKLVDMGLARLHQMDSSTEDLTASGVTLGTFDYISPEQARDPRNTDVRSDLYSLGCTLFFMLTGKPPFPDGTVLQKLLSHSGDEPPDLLKSRPDLDAGVGTIVTKMLAKAPERRFQTPRELIAALLLLADRLDMPGILRRQHTVGQRSTAQARLVAAPPAMGCSGRTAAAGRGDPAIVGPSGHATRPAAAPSGPRRRQAGRAGGDRGLQQDSRLTLEGGRGTGRPEWEQRRAIRSGTDRLGAWGAGSGSPGCEGTGASRRVAEQRALRPAVRRFPPGRCVQQTLTGGQTGQVDWENQYNRRPRRDARNLGSGNERR